MLTQARPVVLFEVWLVETSSELRSCRRTFAELSLIKRLKTVTNPITLDMYPSKEVGWNMVVLVQNIVGKQLLER